MQLRALLLAVTVAAVPACKKASDHAAAPAPTPVATPSTDPAAPSEPPTIPAVKARAYVALATGSEATLASTVVGKPAPAFTLKDLAGNEVSLASFRGKTVVLEWFNPGCPYVKKAHTVGPLVDTAKRHAANGVVWLAINSGAAGKQGHDPAENTAAANTWGMAHPILRDEDGTVGKAYGATNTPNMFVIDPSGVVVYGGAIDNSPDGEGKSPQGGTLVNHVDAALEDLAAGRPVATPVTKPYGCGVKYAS